MDNNGLERSAQKIISSFEITDVIKFLRRKNKTYIAILLNELEDALGKDTVNYNKVRKIVLDSFNGYSRSFLKALFGTDFEDVIK